MSSTIVFGWTSHKELLEQIGNEEMSNLDFGYSQTKWVSEQIVREARTRGLEVDILRPSFLTASAKGVGDSTDIVVRLLSFMIRIGVFPDAQNQISFLPVDVAARIIASFVVQQDPENRDCHIVVDDYYNLTSISEEITRLTGQTFALVDTRDFIETLRSKCTVDDPMYPLLDFALKSWPKVAAMESKRYNSSHYRARRKSQFPAYEEPSLATVTSQLIDHLRAASLV